MISIDAKQQSVLSAEYTKKGYAIIPRLVDPEIAAEWELKHRLLPGKKVHVGNDRQTVWTEQTFSNPSQALGGLAFADEFINLITKIGGLHSIDRHRTQVWINRYGPGDRVPSHCDGAGSTQLVLCLQGLPEAEKGGDLMIRGEVVPLRAGDAVLFFARGVPHAIPPIRSAKVGPSGFSRVTCVIRLYAPNDR
jgi:2OG-Fe(II) oxygenase superfamily